MGRQREGKLSLDIQHMIRERGGWCYKVWGNALTPAGIPDIICCYHGLFVAFETKTPTGELSRIQEHTHKKMRAANAFVFVPRSVEEASAALDEVDELLESYDNYTDESE